MTLAFPVTTKSSEEEVSPPTRILAVVFIPPTILLLPAPAIIGPSNPVAVIFPAFTIPLLCKSRLPPAGNSCILLVLEFTTRGYLSAIYPPQDFIM